MEWWYVNSHLEASDGRAFSMFAAFFRVDVSEPGDKERNYTHFLTWALVDPAAGKYYPHTLLDPQTPALALEEADRRAGEKDERLGRAFREVVARNVVPLPDRLMPDTATVALDSLSLEYGGNRFRKLPNGDYTIDLASHASGVSVQLQFSLVKPVVRHGDDGVVRGVAGDEMFYYFSPRCRVSGAIGIDGTRIDVRGEGWYDHEFGNGYGRATSSEGTVAWNWVAAQLDNGCEISAYDLIDKHDPAKSHGRWVIVVDRRAAAGYTEFTLDTLDAWTSTRTFNEYPTRYLLRIPEAGIALDVVAVLPAQEMITVISPPGFWEGLTDVTGTMDGHPVRGRGFIERSGMSVVDTTDEFFASVGRETRRAIDRLMPERPTAPQALSLIGGREHYLDGISIDQYSSTVLQPIREIILRGGKAWRSYGMLACMDLVGGNSQDYANWIALPELLHVGS